MPLQQCSEAYGEPEVEVLLLAMLQAILGKVKKGLISLRLGSAMIVSCYKKKREGTLCTALAAGWVRGQAKGNWQ